MVAKGANISLGFLVLTCLFFVCLFCAGDGADDGNATSDLEKENAAFARFEGQVVSFVKDSRRRAFPFITRAAYDITLSSTCTRSLTKLYNDVVDLKAWALKLLDSSGKIGDGVMRGSMSMLGDYDECLTIEETDKKSRNQSIVGRYCLVFLHMPQTLLTHLKKFSLGKIKKTSSTERFKELFDLMSRYKFNGSSIHLRAGICIPSTCSKEELQTMLDYGLKDTGLGAEIRNCDVKGQYTVGVDQIIILSIFGLVLIIVIVGTFLDLFHPNAGETKISPSDPVKRKTVSILCHFSIPSNMRKLFSDEFEEESFFNIPCLRGLIVLIFCFFMVAETYAFLDEHIFRNFRGSMNYFDFLKEPLFALIANFALLSEVFFCISGFSFFSHPDMNAEKSKPSSSMVAVRSILRYVLPLLVAIGSFLLLPLFGDGPAWHEVLDPQLSACRRNWWTNILFISNFFKLEDQCLLPTFFLGCFVQLLIVGFIFKFFINKWRILGIGGLVLVAIVCNVLLGVSAAVENLPPALSMYFIFSKEAMAKVAESSYFLPHGHIGSLAVGMIAGFWKSRYPNFKVKNVWIYGIWIFIVAIMSALVFGLYPYHDGREIGIASLCLYAGLHRTVFSILVALGLLTALHGKPGVLNRMLSSKHFLPLRKLIYLAFLLHWAVIFFHVGISRERQYLNHYEQVFRSFSHITVTFLLAFVYYLIFNGVFTLDLVLIPLMNSDGSRSVTLFKSWFSRRTFKVQSSHMTINAIEKNFQFESHKMTPQ